MSPLSCTLFSGSRFIDASASCCQVEEKDTIEVWVEGSVGKVLTCKYMDLSQVSKNRHAKTRCCGMHL